MHRAKAFSIGEADSCTCSPELYQTTYEEYYHLQEWDTVRSHRITALDNVLEALGTQLVPPDFHQTSTGSSLFGSQDSADKPNGTIDPQLSPSATVRGNLIERKTHNYDRTKWKTLRDFADEAAVEEVLDAVESDRTRIDVSIGTFATFKVDTGQHSGHHDVCISLPGHTYLCGYIYTRLVTNFSRISFHTTYCFDSGNNYDGNGKAFGESGITL